MRGMKNYIHLLWIFMLTRPGCSERILMNALLGEGSHFLSAAAVGESLVQRGHNVTFLISNAYSHRATDPKFTELFDFVIFKHPVPVAEVHAQFEQYNTNAFKPAFAQMWSLMKTMQEGRIADCDALLGDDDMMSRLAGTKFSMVIFDIAWHCPILIASRLEIPYIGISPTSLPCIITEPLGSTMNTAFVPGLLTGFSNRMNLKNRILNTLAHYSLKPLINHYTWPFESLKDKHKIAAHTSMRNLYAGSELILINSDFSVEFPCATPPNVIPVGGLTTRPSSPLPDDLEQFLQSSGDDGVVVCSMGTYFTLVPPKIIRDFLNAFGRLQEKVIFQLRQVPEGIEVPPNVMTLPWLPQNDLLGHEKTRAFMYQGGNNGFYEAIYHAVPIVVIPIHVDQYDTGAKVTAHGLGITIDKFLMTEDTIYDALREVTTNASYAHSMRRVSNRFRDRPMAPAEKAAYWVDHVMKHGAAHYRLPYVEQNFIQRNLIDVTCILSGALVIIICAVAFICWKLLNVMKFGLKITGLKVKKE